MATEETIFACLPACLPACSASKKVGTSEAITGRYGRDEITPSNRVA